MKLVEQIVIGVHLFFLNTVRNDRKHITVQGLPIPQAKRVVSQVDRSYG